MKGLLVAVGVAAVLLPQGSARAVIEPLPEVIARAQDGRMTDGSRPFWVWDHEFDHNHFRADLYRRVCAEGGVVADVWSLEEDGSWTHRMFDSTGAAGTEPFAEGPVGGSELFFALPTGFETSAIIDVQIDVAEYSQTCDDARVVRGWINQPSLPFDHDARDAQPQLLELL